MAQAKIPIKHRFVTSANIWMGYMPSESALVMSLSQAVMAMRRFKRIIQERKNVV
jgi:hypothetical protein